MEGVTSHPNRGRKVRTLREVEAQRAPAPTNLVELWLQVILSIPGASMSGALGDLNRETGQRYTLSRLGEWRNGRREVPRAAALYMRRIAIGRALELALGQPSILVPDEQLDRLAELLS